MPRPSQVQKHSATSEELWKYIYFFSGGQGVKLCDYLSPCNTSLFRLLCRAGM